MRRALALAAFSLLAACRSTADAPGTVISTAPPVPRTVAVTGVAEIETTPDEFVVTVGVDTTGPDAARAKSANDAIMRALLDVPRQLGVDPRWVRTEGFALAPHFEGPWDARRLVGFEAHKTLVLVLHDDKQVEPVLEALFRDGANRIEGVQFKSTKILEQRKQARTKAVAAAREKAEAMASVLGQKVGRPLRIDETGEPSSSPWSRPPESNLVFNNETRSELREAMAAGKIRIPATVSITFELGEG